jgi:hypothetical protein
MKTYCVIFNNKGLHCRRIANQTEWEGCVRPFHRLSVGFMSEITKLNLVLKIYPKFCCLGCNFEEVQTQSWYCSSKVLSFYPIIFQSVRTELKCHKGMLTVRVETKGAEIKERQNTRASKLCTLVPNTCGCSVCNLLHVVLLAPETFGCCWIIYLENLCTPDIENRYFI